MKLLLTSVFKPFGVDDDFGRKENKMELYHNQVTREQGIFSPRSNHRTFGLYTIAENIEVPTVILDFPTLPRFIEEIKKGYEHIGVSFITPNFIKAKKMAELVREFSPKSKIILGGHGTMIPDIEKLIPCDSVIRGDGVEGMRRYFNEDLNKPFIHPIVRSSEHKSIFGVGKTSSNGFLVTGNGCSMGCRFCSTSHFFNRRYVAFLKTGKEIYDTVCKIENQMNTKSFQVYDENFSSQKERTLEFIELIEKNKKKWEFNLFSSANAILELGLENIARLNVGWMWIGVESKFDVFEKNRNIDLKGLIRSLQGSGIPVLASAILFHEHHTRKNIMEDIDYVIGLKPDFIQFMQLLPLPQTQLYKDLKQSNQLRENLPYEAWHGQQQICFRHPEFSPEDTERILREAFLRDYDHNGPSIYRVYKTIFNGYRNLKFSKNSKLKEKSIFLAKECEKKYPYLSVIATMAPQKHIREEARRTMREYKREFGSVTAKNRLKEVYFNIMARYEKARQFIFGDVLQPETIYTTYRFPKTSPSMNDRRG